MHPHDETNTQLTHNVIGFGGAKATPQGAPSRLVVQTDLEGAGVGVEGGTPHEVLEEGGVVAAGDQLPQGDQQLLAEHELTGGVGEPAPGDDANSGSHGLVRPTTSRRLLNRQIIVCSIDWLASNWQIDSDENN